MPDEEFVWGFFSGSFTTQRTCKRGCECCNQVSNYLLLYFLKIGYVNLKLNKIGYYSIHSLIKKNYSNNYSNANRY